MNRHNILIWFPSVLFAVLIPTCAETQSIDLDVSFETIELEEIQLVPLRYTVFAVEVNPVTGDLESLRIHPGGELVLSVFDGSDWSEEAVVSGDASNGFTPRLDFDEDGNRHIVWFSTYPETRSFYVKIPLETSDVEQEEEEQVPVEPVPVIIDGTVLLDDPEVRVLFPDVVCFQNKVYGAAEVRSDDGSIWVAYFEISHTDNGHLDIPGVAIEVGDLIEIEGEVITAFPILTAGADEVLLDFINSDYEIGFFAFDDLEDHTSVGYIRYDKPAQMDMIRTALH